LAPPVEYDRIINAAAAMRLLLSAITVATWAPTFYNFYGCIKSLPPPLDPIPLLLPLPPSAKRPLLGRLWGQCCGIFRLGVSAAETHFMHFSIKRSLLSDDSSF